MPGQRPEDSDGKATAVDKAEVGVVGQSVPKRSARQHFDVIAPAFKVLARLNDRWANRRIGIRAPILPAQGVQIRSFDANTNDESELAEIDGVHYVPGGNLFDVAVEVGSSRRASRKYELIRVRKNIRLRFVIIRKRALWIRSIVVTGVVETNSGIGRTESPQHSR